MTVSYSPTLPTAVSGVRLIPLHNELWRVTGPRGTVLGYIELVRRDDQGAAGNTYRAKRVAGNLRAFVPVGDFWELRDAVDSLRFG